MMECKQRQSQLKEEDRVNETAEQIKTSQYLK